MCVRSSIGRLTSEESIKPGMDVNSPSEYASVRIVSNGDSNRADGEKFRSMPIRHPDDSPLYFAFINRVHSPSQSGSLNT